MNKNQEIYLRDILERIARIEQVMSVGESVFKESFMHQDTAIRNFEVIGEIIKRLDSTLLSQQPQVNWRGYMGFRDVLIHQYDGIDPVEVWLTVEQDLPNLKQAITILLSTLPKPGDS